MELVVEVNIQPTSSEPSPPQKDSKRERGPMFSEGNVSFAKYLERLEIHPEFWSLFDLAAFIAGAVGGGLVAYNRYHHIGSPVPIAASLTGLVIGA
ncbi:hypothetical protein [Yinghuangia seranimata]|uniref:hypothetical protein n=1 Tax=Yinghuangia seranimata TaxID=408067 RepID=UPI00248BAE82|nr:hypothetical protein [Yinghuangia seranimata]MDI2127810.1 hypothetical protein [Yinghuangia seranimata]